MKKLLLCMTVCILFSISASAEAKTVTATIPDYQIVIDDSLVYTADSLYPFLNYKGITYLPMTYEYARAMNLTTGWLPGTAFMVAYTPIHGAELPVYETCANTKYNIAVLPTGYNMYVNGKKVENAAAEYPLLNFRGVTYFPMTWEYAVENFGWKLSFENGVFRINTGKVGVTYSVHISLAEQRETDVIFEKRSFAEIPQEDGSVQMTTVTEYISVDYKTGETKTIWDYIPKEKDESSPLVNIGEEVSVRDGYVYYEEQKLEGIYIKEAADDFVKPENVLTAGYNVSADTSTAYAPLHAIEVFVYTENRGTESSWGRRERYTFVETARGMEPIGACTTIENVQTLGDDIYFNTVEYGLTISRHYKYNRKLWKLSKDGVLREIQYADYHSMRILGKANGKLYLKCEWAPENYLDDYGPGQISLVNDGYHTFDGEGITFISPYIYSDFDVVSENGDIIAVNQKLGKITRCPISPAYY